MSRRKTRKLQETVECETDEIIKEYMSNKSLIVYASKSFVEDEVKTPNDNALVLYLAPLVEKRLDFRYHKDVWAKIEERHLEIQDSYLQILSPESQVISLADFSVSSEDVVTREFYDPAIGENVNTLESMVTINLELITTTNEEKRDAYDSLTLLGDIGGLIDFLIMILTPLIGFIVGDRFTYEFMKSLYMMNRKKEDNGRSSNKEEND